MKTSSLILLSLLLGFLLQLPGCFSQHEKSHFRSTRTPRDCPITDRDRFILTYAATANTALGDTLTFDSAKEEEIEELEQAEKELLPTKKNRHLLSVKHINCESIAKEAQLALRLAPSKNFDGLCCAETVVEWDAGEPYRKEDLRYVHVVKTFIAAKNAEGDWVVIHASR